MLTDKKWLNERNLDESYSPLHRRSMGSGLMMGYAKARPQASGVRGLRPLSRNGGCEPEGHRLRADFVKHSVVHLCCSSTVGYIACGRQPVIIRPPVTTAPNELRGVK